MKKRQSIASVVNESRRGSTSSRSAPRSRPGSCSVPALRATEVVKPKPHGFSSGRRRTQRGSVATITPGSTATSPRTASLCVSILSRTSLELSSRERGSPGPLEIRDIASKSRNDSSGAPSTSQTSMGEDTTESVFLENGVRTTISRHGFGSYTSRRGSVASILNTTGSSFSRSPRGRLGGPPRSVATPAQQADGALVRTQSLGLQATPDPRGTTQEAEVGFPGLPSPFGPGPMAPECGCRPHSSVDTTGGVNSVLTPRGNSSQPVATAASSSLRSMDNVQQQTNTTAQRDNPFTLSPDDLRQPRQDCDPAATPSSSASSLNPSQLQYVLQLQLLQASQGNPSEASLHQEEALSALLQKPRESLAGASAGDGVGVTPFYTRVPSQEELMASGAGDLYSPPSDPPPKGAPLPLPTATPAQGSSPTSRSSANSPVPGALPRASATESPSAGDTGGPSILWQPPRAAPPAGRAESTGVGGPLSGSSSTAALQQQEVRGSGSIPSAGSGGAQIVSQQVPSPALPQQATHGASHHTPRSSLTARGVGSSAELSVPPGPSTGRLSPSGGGVAEEMHLIRQYQRQQAKGAARQASTPPQETITAPQQQGQPPLSVQPPLPPAAGGNYTALAGEQALYDDVAQFMRWRKEAGENEVQPRSRHTTLPFGRQQSPPLQTREESHSAATGVLPPVQERGRPLRAQASVQAQGDPENPNFGKPILSQWVWWSQQSMKPRIPQPPQSHGGRMHSPRFKWHSTKPVSTPASDPLSTPGPRTEEDAALVKQFVKETLASPGEVERLRSVVSSDSASSAGTGGYAPGLLRLERFSTGAASLDYTLRSRDDEDAVNPPQLCPMFLSSFSAPL